MPPLSPELKAELGKRLHQSRDALLAAARARMASPQGDPPQIAPGAHMVQGDDSPEAEMISHDEQHLADHETAILHEIDGALARLESGAAGICTTCGRDIPEARLLAAPTAHTCIECQQRLERGWPPASGPTM